MYFQTLIHLISRTDGKLKRTFTAEKFFFFHTINQFETLDKDYIVLDLCCYKDAKMLDCMYIESIKNMHKNPNYAELFRGRPLRFILPLGKDGHGHRSEENLIKIETVHQTVNSNDNNNNNNRNFRDTKDMLSRKASAYFLPDGKIFVKPELICDLGCETPRFNYERLGKEYRYFYAISSDVDLDNPGTVITDQLHLRLVSYLGFCIQDIFAGHQGRYCHQNSGHLERKGSLSKRADFRPKS